MPAAMAGLAVAGHGIGGHRDDARRSPGGQRPVMRATPRGRPSRHLHVHQHHVVGLALDAPDGLDAVAGEVGAVAHLPQQAQRELLVHDVVLGEQDAQRVARQPCRRPSSAGGRCGRRGVGGEHRHQRVEELALAQRPSVAPNRPIVAGGPRRPSEVKRTSGIVAPIARSRRRARSTPSMPGMCMSTMARSKRAPSASHQQRLPGDSVSRAHDAPSRGLQRQDAGWSRCRRRRAGAAGQRRLDPGEASAARQAARRGARIVKRKVDPVPVPARRPTWCRPSVPLDVALADRQAPARCRRTCAWSTSRPG